MKISPKKKPTKPNESLNEDLDVKNAVNNAANQLNKRPNTESEILNILNQFNNKLSEKEVDLKTGYALLITKVCSVGDSKDFIVNESKEESIPEFDKSLFEELKFFHLEDYIKEIFEDEFDGYLKFTINLYKHIKALEFVIDNKEVNQVDSVMDMLSGLLLDTNMTGIPQRKYIYNNIGRILTDNNEEYEFISPLNSDFFDSSIHKIVEGEGQRIINGSTFILKQKKDGVVLRYGEVKVR